MKKIGLLALGAILIALISYGLTLSIQTFVLAWTEPASAPPLGAGTFSSGSSKWEDGVGEPNEIYYSAGNVGIGTSNPAEKLHVIGDYALFDVDRLKLTDGSPDLIFETTLNTRTSWMMSAWDEDIEHSRFVLRSFPDNSNYGTGAGTMRLVVDGDNGNVGIGVNMPNPSYKLHVNGDIYTSGSYEPSDVRLKENIIDINEPLNVLSGMRGVYFDWKDKEKGAERQLGFIAQEVELLLPEVVTTDGDGMKSIEYGKTTALIVEAVKELKIEKDAEIAELKAQNQALADVLCQLKPEASICAGL